jgi:hypothetical protein
VTDPDTADLDRPSPDVSDFPRLAEERTRSIGSVIRWSGIVVFTSMAVTILTLLAAILVVRHLTTENESLHSQVMRNQSEQECRSRIGAYADGVGSALDRNGWGALVSRVTTGEAVDRSTVFAVARLTVAARDAAALRSKAVDICRHDPAYEPPLVPSDPPDQPTTTSPGG